MRIFTLISVVCLAFAAPLHAQTIDFGDDASRWSNDGECDDPRFYGEGMTTTPLLDEDIMHDATDCRTAFEAEMIFLHDDTTRPGGKGSGSTKPVAQIDGINFGDDSGEWAMDGECDDRRFYGEGMAIDLSWTYVGVDATDCAEAYQAGRVKLWDYGVAKAATVCEQIDFGDNAGAYPEDLECDDQRFEGPGSAMSLTVENIGHDAADCSHLCEFGVVFLRDYE